MKKYILILLTTWCSLVTFAQSITEKIKFSVKDNNTEYSIRSSFPAERTERIRSVLEGMLGEASNSSASESQWATTAYSAKLLGNRFEAFLDKKKATGHQIALFEKLTEKLQEELKQPKPPQPPKQP
ncbi:hypothetical protein [Pedobacter chitinilyticus]|uniref:Uncharacterized protein n=1 Tax=Pedobacter chitinilyticus TaxID=2233776 RepID=A0A3S3SRY7_9SPHI|nr:hypothetical protein [Pedobacter chitinilyticus]RWU04334.1 hypothetical protein DPV69_18620 [Pedobacter chitinilyticus]